MNNGLIFAKQVVVRGFRHVGKSTQIRIRVRLLRQLGLQCTCRLAYTSQCIPEPPISRIFPYQTPPKLFPAFTFPLPIRFNSRQQLLSLGLNVPQWYPRGRVWRLEYNRLDLYWCIWNVGVESERVQSFKFALPQPSICRSFKDYWAFRYCFFYILFSTNIKCFTESLSVITMYPECSSSVRPIALELLQVVQLRLEVYVFFPRLMPRQDILAESYYF